MPEELPPEQWLTTAEAAKRLRVHVTTILNFIHRNDLPASKFGRQWRIAESDLRTWQEKGRGQVSDVPLDANQHMKLSGGAQAELSEQGTLQLRITLSARETYRLLSLLYKKRALLRQASGK